MFTIRLTIEYDGQPFHGWQKQLELRTVQAEIERAIITVIRQEIRGLASAGRTDAGVHARGQVVSFRVAEKPDLERLMLGVSSILRGEVSILSAEIAADDFHAQRSVVAREYHYRILNRPAPAVLSRGQVWHISEKLDIDAMNRAAALLLGEHDFSSFRGAGCSATTPIKELTTSEVRSLSDEIRYRVIGSGFLKQMVRNIVGTLVQIGRRERAAEQIPTLLAARDRQQAGPTAPAYGLCLYRVYYDAAAVPK